MTGSRFPRLFSPLTLRGVTIPNRIVVPGHATLYMMPDGLPTERQLHYLLSKARGGAGLIIGHAHSVAPMVPGETPVGLQREQFVSAYAPVVEAVRAEGARYLIQLTHPGGVGSPRGSGPVTRGPSAVAHGAMVRPQAMTRGEIEQRVENYHGAAARAREAGFDGIEIMAEVSFLVAQFLSPFYNRRDDEYGGSLENRLRFARDVIATVREAVGPDRIVAIRIAGDEFLDGGLGLDDMLEIAPLLEATGELDYLHIGAGPGRAAHVPPAYFRPGSFLYLTEAIRRVVAFPLLTSQRIKDPLAAEELLERGIADLVAMNRALMANPKLPAKARQGRLDEIRPCIACNECIGRFRDQMPIACSMNADMGREQKMELVPADRPRRVMVVGGGPAGLEAARVAALRGHRVSLYERAEELGGQTRLAARAPLRDEMGGVARYFATQLRIHKVDVCLGTEVTAELVARERPDVVVVATGSRAPEPAVETSDTDRVVGARDVLAGTADVGERVVVLARDQHVQALSVADFLAESGHEVELWTTSYAAGEQLDWGTRERIYHRLLGAGVRIVTLTDARALRGRRLVGACVLTGRERELDGVDTLVVAAAPVPDDRLARELAGTGIPAELIGDALSPRRIIDAVFEGAQAARRI